MATPYGQVKATFWKDPDILAISDHAKLLALYYLTGCERNALGVYFCPTEYVAAHVHLTAAEQAQSEAELEDVDFLRRCVHTQYVWVRNYLRHNEPQNPSHWKHVEGLMAEIPDTFSYLSELKDYFTQCGHPVDTLPTPRRHPGETLSRPSRHTKTNTEPETKPEPMDRGELGGEGGVGGEEREHAKPNGDGRHYLPDGWRPDEDLNQLASDLGLNPAHVADQFCDYWRNRDDSRARKKDWRAAFRVWCRKEAGVFRTGEASRAGPPRHGVLQAANGAAALTERRRSGQD